MAEEIEAALGVLKRTMDIEQEGREFYLKASRTTQDDKGREAFSILAGDEEKHYDLINRQYEALVSSGQWIDSPEIKPIDIDLDKPLLPQGTEGLGKAVTSKSSDREALLFGLDIETRSYDLYRKAASKTSSNLGKRMFEFLAGEERGHFNILMMRYEGLFGPASWLA